MYMRRLLGTETIVLLLILVHGNGNDHSILSLGVDMSTIMTSLLNYGQELNSK